MEINKQNAKEIVERAIKKSKTMIPDNSAPLMTHDIETIKMPCLECKEMVEVKMGGYEEQGVFNVFCSDPKKDCEDRFAWKQ